VAKGVAAPPFAMLSGKGYRGVHLSRRGRPVVVIQSEASQSELSYTAPPGLHLVLDAPQDAKGRSAVTGTRSGAGCRIAVRPGAGYDARPLMIRVGADCAVAEEPKQPTSGPSPG